MTIKYWFSRVATIGVAGLMVIVMSGNSVYAHDSCQSPTNQSDPSLSNWNENSIEADYTELQTLTERQVFSPMQSGLETGFGFHTKLKGDTLAVAQRNQFGEYQGAVDIFEYQNDEWQYSKTLKPPNQQAHDQVSRIAFNAALWLNVEFDICIFCFVYIVNAMISICNFNN